MNYYKILFNIIEFIAFILPALPSSLLVRLLILLIYFIGHCFKLQYAYSQIKVKYITLIDTT
jgi:hypothetical protein